ncbi:MAG: SDR family NAD(P)-dependent oxidoreductase [Pirellulaceae bacterium]|nr:SDR family NAD(P)-dependent oxidoreductase [Pirellulaceae bacterium]
MTSKTNPPALGGQVPSSIAEPIAIIGMGCRLPGGADDWQTYWRMLESGMDAISETPPDRWSLQKFYVPHKSLPGKTQSKWGGYVRNIDHFDPQLFGISPREAASMDPQQRMLLESAFRAIEDAGQRADRLAGQPVAVFIGISSFDYAVAGLSFQDRGVIDAYSNTGGSSSIAANRISYCFDLRGPSVAVDTACSSSLVAVHMACESIWRGQASMALAGGVNALILPDFYVAFSQLGVMSPDGRCKTFDARANGYVRSEGAGAVLLKPLRAALSDKDPIYAVIRATALNQDGRTPGMTVPSQAAQEALILAACQQAGVSPSELQYVEAHGTGTPVGDPIETKAIGSVVGQGRDPQNRCWVGSVKTNIGHLEAGAGIASLIKVALSLHHRRIPRNLHFRQANPEIDLAALGLRVPTQTEIWTSDRSRLAGINGFGYGGANAHVIIEQAPESAAQVHSITPSRTVPATALRTKVVASGPSAASTTSAGVTTEATETAPPVLLPLSARSPSALQQSASQLSAWLSAAGAGYHLAEVAGLMAHRRTHFDCRWAVCAADHESMIDQLQTLANSTPSETAQETSAAQLSRGAAFVCSGQGPQWWAMGRGLIKHSPVFRSMLKRCDAEFSRYGTWSLLEELERSESTSRMQQTSIAQPSIFAIQVALAALWESWGIKPTAVVGHSVGEIAAAYLSGALSWEDACCVAFHRGRTMDLASSQGAMVAAGLSPDQVPQWIEGLEAQVSLAAINGPTSVTISGAAPAIAQLATRLESAAIFCRRLAVEYAFHSPQMDPVRDELLRSLAHLRPRTVHTTLVSTVTGQPIDGSQLGADYWWQNVRHSVRFADAMYRLAEMGYGVAVELGPHPVLAYSINECFQAVGCHVHSVASLNRQQGDLWCISKSLGSLYSLGYDIHWEGFYNQPTRKLPLPTYPFQTQRLWNESLESQWTRNTAAVHPLLGEPADHQQPVWQQRVDLKLQNYLADHRVRGSVIYPAAAMLETAVAAAYQLSLGADQPCAEVRLERLRLHNPCLLADDQPQWIETRWNADRRQLNLGFRSCKLSASGEAAQWSSLATVEISAQPLPTTDQKAQSQRLEQTRSRCLRQFTAQQLYDYCAQLGLQYGPQFQGVVSGVQRPGEALAEVVLTKSIDPSAYVLHPALLDSCFHVMIAADSSFDHALDGLYLPAELREIWVYSRSLPSGSKLLDTATTSDEGQATGFCGQRLLVHARVLRKTAKKMWCDLDITTIDGQPLVTIRGFESHRVLSPSTIQQTEDLIYKFHWQRSALPNLRESQVAASEQRWLVFMDEGHVGQEICERLRASGRQVVEVYQASSHVPQTPARQFHQFNPESRQDFVSLLERFASAPLTHAVYLWGMDVPANDVLNCTSLRSSTLLTTLAPLHFVQAWESIEALGSANFTIVTRGAQSADDAPEHCNVAQAPLIGMGRVIVNEYGRLRSKLVDMPATLRAGDFDQLFAELLATDDEDEVKWRDGHRWVQRFVQQRDQALGNEALSQLPFQLRLGKSSGVEELRYETKARGPLQPGHVEIEVVAAGLNFSDVMKALDLYPGLNDAVVDLGAECSGKIVRVAPGSRWNVGDEVMAVAPGAFSSHVIVDEQLVARKPCNLSFEQAAAIPVAFLTAQYALHDCARLSRGDSILIHAASGGVGLAAMQFAAAAGVRILATAGSPEKRKFVQQQGASCVMDSRTLSFGAQTLEATGGEGVDAVLNSLPGPAIATGLGVLKTGGRFLEIGKRDIYNDAALGLYPFRNNLALFAIDLDQLFKQQPARMGQMLRDLSARFESGELHALPTEVYSTNETAAAFKFMQQGKHIGKVVVNYQQRPEFLAAGSYDPVQFKADRTYWIAGGLGGFGLEIAKWMAQRGAGHLVLSGRSPQPRPEVTKEIAQLTQQGVAVTILPADITRPDEVHRVLASIDRQLPPLAGILHTAMVLEDKLLADLDRDTLERVLWPKVLGGWNLHQQTLDRQLDMFVLFSSLSSVFGHAGQANYSAANALLDSLAHYRRSQGSPGLVINWGHLGEVGYLAQRQQLGSRLERQGVLSFTVRQATDCLEYALQTLAVQLSVLKMDWSVWRGLGITNRVSPRFASLLQQAEGAGQPSGATATADGLRSSSPAERRALISDMLRSKIGSLLGIAAQQIRDDRALLELGLDSLMAVELRNWIESQLEITLPISALMRGHSLGELIDQIAAMIVGSNSSAPSTVSPRSPMQSTEQVAKLSSLLPAHAASPTAPAPDTPRNLAPISSAQITGQIAAELLDNLENMDDDQVAQLLNQVLNQ